MGRYKKKREKKGIRVDVRNNNVEWALKKMKRMVKDSGMMLELKRRTYYKKPSEEKREMAKGTWIASDVIAGARKISY